MELKMLDASCDGSGPGEDGAVAGEVEADLRPVGGSAAMISATLGEAVTRLGTLGKDVGADALP